ncbi:hypothetical protein HT102_03335 [Hoyosella sp. G463]|uniref:Uncharacterized protein n=1 Tax=Lolliginicoccus lacisalsi TaxID=2742202 RepID=A0A927JA87_9ACTN|nr:hypothetical protein [Lolliginicoccus lacisalsi]MBD8505524.1 hypothetical protein [Lolliginicoccus lacisalsi]
MNTAALDARLARAAATLAQLTERITLAQADFSRLDQRLTQLHRCHPSRQLWRGGR